MRILRLLLLAALVSGGCGGAKEAYDALGGLRQLHADLTAKYHDEISIRIDNGKHLSIGFVNSPRKELPADVKARTARDIAAWAIGRYPDAGKLETVSVGFITHKSYVVVSFTDASDQYGFTAAELASREPGPAAQPLPETRGPDPVSGAPSAGPTADPQRGNR